MLLCYEGMSNTKGLNAKILLIDDNVDITKMFSKYLKMKGFECLVSNNGRNGVEQIKANSFSHIFLDMAMPEFGGADVIRSLENENLLHKNNIVILTASSISDDEIAELRKKEGVRAVLKKPVQLSELLELLNSEPY